jgi:hypothetical protein
MAKDAVFFEVLFEVVAVNKTVLLITSICTFLERHNVKKMAIMEEV